MTQQLIDKETNQDAFPKLNDAQIEELADFAKCQTFAVGETLIEAGEKDFDFYIVTSGILEVIDRSSGEDKTIATVTEKEFVGDMANLKGHPASATVVVKEDCEVCP